MKRVPLPEKRVMTILPTKVKRAKAQVGKREVEMERQQSKRKAEEDVALAKRDASKRKDKAAVRRGKKKARVATGPGQQEIELESGEDVDSGDDAPICVAAKPVVEAKKSQFFQVALTDGSFISSPACTHRVIDVLTKTGNYQSQDASFLRDHAGVDVLAHENAKFKDMLLSCSAVDAREDELGFTVRKKAPFGVEDKKGLHDLFFNRLPRGEVNVANGLSALTIAEKQLSSMYPAVEQDLDSLVEAGKLGCIDDQSREKWKVFFKAPRGEPASLDIRSLWHSVKLPDTDADLERELVKRKILSKDEILARMARKKAANKADAERALALAEERKQSAKPRVRVGKPIDRGEGDMSALFEDEF